MTRVREVVGFYLCVLQFYRIEFTSSVEDLLVPLLYGKNALMPLRIVGILPALEQETFYVVELTHAYLYQCQYRPV